MLVLSVLTLGAPTTVARPSASAAALVTLPAPTAARPYSDPVWFPLRTPVKVSCIKANCQSAGAPYHNYWAMDLLGNLGDPVYAAGAGIFRIGAIDPGCKSSVNDAGGTWVWIDHGGGTVSRYHHLDSVLAKDGQYVTPGTVIGTMGHSGDVAPCQVNYLHFEVRTGGVTGTRVDPGPLLACVGGARVSWPQVWGKSSWDALTARSVTTPPSTSDCITPTWTTTPAAPSPLTGSRGSTAIRVNWPAAPPGTNRVVVALETYHPSVPEWGLPVYRTVAATTRTQLYTGLQNGRRYRVKVAYHSSAGYSAWSRYLYLTPAARPSTPRAPRWLTATTSKIRYAWYKSAEYGTPTTSYTLAIRKRLSSGYTAWRYTVVPASVFNYNWTTVTRGATYQVTVRANSAVGSSAFATRRYVTVPR